MIHARHQYTLRRHYEAFMAADGIRLRPRRRVLRNYPAAGEHQVMPPSLRTRRPRLFDGTWRTRQQRERDLIREAKWKIRVQAEFERKHKRAPYRTAFDYPF